MREEGQYYMLGPSITLDKYDRPVTEEWSGDCGLVACQTDELLSFSLRETRMDELCRGDALRKE